jgi:hypothetical protein
VPGAFVRSLGPTFVAGFYNNNSIWQPVIITRIDSYENAFSGMLAWENTLVEDFSPFFKTVPVPVAASTPTSTPSSSSTSTPKAAPSVKQSAAASSTTLTAASSKNTFTDEIVANKNARVLSNAKGAKIMYYAFFDKKTLIIAGSIDALKEVFARLTTSQFIQ